MTNDTGKKLKPVAHDDFETEHPDALIAHLSHSPVLKAFTITLCAHVVLILLLSIGNIMMCIKYKTWSVTGAVAEHAEALKEEQAAENKAARAKAQAAKKTKGDSAEAAKNPAEAKTSSAESKSEKSAIEKELEETSSERPTESDLTLDDIDD